MLCDAMGCLRNESEEKHCGPVSFAVYRAQKEMELKVNIVTVLAAII